MYRGVISCIGNDKLRPGFGADGTVIGPEFGFGHVMGYYHEEPVLLIKSSIGNRSLSWDYAPPSTPQYQYDGRIYAGYGQSPNSWLVGEGPTPYPWYAGKQWDDCFLDESEMDPNMPWAESVAYPAGFQTRHNGVLYNCKSAHTSSVISEPGVGAESSTYWAVHSVTNVVDVLDNFAAEYPDYATQGFEIAGYLWWQGHKDQSEPHASNYEQNMVNFINDIRDYYEGRYPSTIPNAPFVLATVAFDGGWENTSPDYLTIAAGQLAVSDPVKHPEFQGNVKTVEARGYWRDSSVSPTGVGYHYNHNAETYLLTGDALGRAMIELQGSFVIDAGDNMISWSTLPVQLDASVQTDVNVSAYTWTIASATPGTTIAFDPAINPQDPNSSNIEDPVVTITKTGAEPAVVELRLMVDDGENVPVIDTMTITVYDDGCQAAREAVYGPDDNPTDITGDDCITNIQDLAELVFNWLNQPGLLEPQHK